MKFKFGFAFMCFLAATHEQKNDISNQSISMPLNNNSLNQQLKIPTINLNLNKKQKNQQNPSPQILKTKTPSNIATPSPSNVPQKIGQLKFEAESPQFQILNQKKIPFYCGISNQILDVPPYNSTKRQILVRTIYGFNMYVDSKDKAVSRRIKNEGTWEPHFIVLLGNIIKPGFNVLNLGSQSGLQAIVMGRLIGPNGKMFIFEPYSFSNELVTKNIKLNGLQQITTIYKIGASDQKGKAIINVSYQNTGGSEIVNQVQKVGQFGAISESQQVELQRVDQLLPKDVILDFALIDVQKMQIKALKGLKGVIERSPNLVIMTEWQYSRNPKAIKEQTLDLLKYMQNLNYTPYAYFAGIGCTIGKFCAFEHQELLRIGFIDIFFFPKHIPLPK